MLQPERVADQVQPRRAQRRTAHELRQRIGRDSQLDSRIGAEHRQAQGKATLIVVGGIALGDAAQHHPQGVVGKPDGNGKAALPRLGKRCAAPPEHDGLGHRAGKGLGLVGIDRRHGGPHGSLPRS